MAESPCRAYEQAFARWLGVGHAYSFWKGRVALYAALRAMGITDGDEVVVPGYTCVMAVNPILYRGAKPVYVDIDPATFNIDPSLIESRITPKTRLIIAQHTYGYPAAMDRILDIASRHSLPVIEDCCLALGSRWEGRTVGTLGQAAYFSFQWNKPYTSGLGGMLVTNDDTLAAKVEDVCREERVAPGRRETAMLRAQMAVHRTLVYPKTTVAIQTLFRWLTRTGLVVGSSTTSEFDPAMEADFFKGMGAAQARVGLRRLRRLADNIAHRQRLTRMYKTLLLERGFPTPELPSAADPVLVRYPVRVADKDRALAMAGRHLVELGSWFECPLHPIETPLERYGYEPGLCPASERACREVVNLPVHPRASEASVRRTVAFIAQIGPAAQNEPEGTH